MGLLGASSISLLSRSIDAIADDASSGKSKIKAITKTIAQYPFKILASFIMAPFLLVRMAWKVKSIPRRIFAIIGIILAVISSYAAGTTVGSITGALFIGSHVSWLVGLGFLIGSTLSIFLSVLFSFTIFASTSYLFLKMNNEDLLSYLDEISS